ncbi:MAG TPA: Nif3-like dinuclear metal center hexameric protein [Planctomycetota bacterium]|nr:Nif3-like dinuclear metal center hexameric protein [Planctomycetota bacterium]
MKISELDKFFIDLAPDVRKAGTCDGLKLGKPDAQISGIATTHVATVPVIRQAIQLNCNLIITHEGVFYNGDAGSAADPVSARKLDILQENSIAVYCMRDLWDTFENYGTVDSWAAQLGLGKAVKADGLRKIYEVPTQPLLEFSRRVKEMMHLQAVRVAGDVQNSVSRVGLGAGEHGRADDLIACAAMGADCFVAGESTEWIAARYAVDAGISMIVTGHTESENPGMENLAKFIKERFPEMHVEFLDAGNVYVYL